MKKFINKSFLLQTPEAEELFFSYAVDMPIIDYHCHLNPQQIAEDVSFDNLTQLWLAGDHYKWRAMRANGIDEKKCDGFPKHPYKMKNQKCLCRKLPQEHQPI